MGNFIAWDAHRQDRLVEEGAMLGLVGWASNRRQCYVLPERLKVTSRRSMPRLARSDIEKVGHGDLPDRWTSVIRGSPSASAPATAPASSVASIGPAEKARNSRQIFQHTHNSRIPPASSRPTVCRICVANPATSGMGLGRGSKADDDDIVTSQHEVDQNDLRKARQDI